MPNLRSDRQSARPGAIVALTLLAAASVYVLRLDRVAGLIVDDAWYVLLGRSLAYSVFIMYVGDGLQPVARPA